jgi:hypothetical protein
MSEPLPPNDELKALIAEERAALSEPGAARARLAERLAHELARAAVVPEPALPVARPRWPRGLTTALATFGAGMATGAIVHSVVAPAPPVQVRYVDRIVEVERVPEVTVSPDAGPVAEPPRETVRPAPREPAHALPERVQSPDQALARERLLIDKARSALARRDAQGALVALKEHSRAFPRGQLVEAREALAVQALASEGRADEARQRALRFHERFPGSPYAPVVDAAISEIP